MGREVYQEEPKVELQQVNIREENFQVSFPRKERIVINLTRAQVDVCAQIVRPQEENQRGLGRTSTQEGEEVIEVTVTEDQTRLSWKVVERGMWCLKHRIGFPRTQVGN